GSLFRGLTAGIAVNATGHCHPHVVEAIQDQATKLLHMSGTDFYYQPQTDLAQRLAEAGPWPGHRRVFFTNSGAEALEAALKLARWHTGRPPAIAFFGAFHRGTAGARRLAGARGAPGGGFAPRVRDTPPAPSPKGCGPCPDARGCACVRYIEDTLLRRTAPPEEVAAIFVEPIQGE